LRRIFLSESLS